MSVRRAKCRERKSALAERCKKKLGTKNEERGQDEEAHGLKKVALPLGTKWKATSPKSLGAVKLKGMLCAERKEGRGKK